MQIILPELPFKSDALEPYISQTTIETHYGKHHKGYVRKLNELIAGTAYEDMDLEEIVMESFKEKESEPSIQKIYNNAAQAWNHEFYWNSMSPGDKSPSPDFLKIMEKNFNTLDSFFETFKKEAADLFGSGWLWLVKDENDNLSLLPLKDAGNPLPLGKIPLLVCDVWEHAYYLDQKNEREKYLLNFNKIINWEFIEKNFGIGSQLFKAKGFKYNTQNLNIH